MPRKLWFVVPVELDMDAGKGEIYPDGGGIGGLAAEGPAGYFLANTAKKSFDRVFYSQHAAEDYARSQAETSPKTQFGVFECGNIFETTTPTIIIKEFNDAGELRVKGT